MKKLLIVLLVLTLFLCSCDEWAEIGLGMDEDVSADTDTDASTNTDEGTNSDEGKPDGEMTYEDVERYTASGYKNRYYCFENDSTLLRIKHPTEWTLNKVKGGFEIVRDGESVGRLLGAAVSDTEEWTVLKNESQSVDDVSITKYIEQKNGKTEFRYRYVYEYNTNGRTRTVTLIAECAELSEKSEGYLYSEIAKVSKVRSDTVGALSEAVGEPSSILILGNSFVGSSHIGTILKEMISLGGKTCTVEAISRGYANVGTYTDDYDLLMKIRHGQYDAVFICGFYDSPNVQDLGTLKSVCDYSETALIIFPAHNENGGVITAAKKAFPSLYLLDWRSEIDYLIARCGVDKWDMCINDMHLHSTPLAGYVGAHMIYRAIYGELPTEPMRYALDQSYIDSILGDYAYVGDGTIFQKDNTTYLG